MAKCLSETVKKINNKPNANVAELKRMPKNLSLAAEATAAFMQIMGSAKRSPRKVLLRGKLNEYPKGKNTHYPARPVEMLNQFSDELQNCPKNDPRTNFLLEELEVLEEAKGIRLPNFFPRTTFLTVSQRKVKGISSKPPSFVARVWDYIEGAVIRVLMRHSENYP
ncbi:Protein kinase domain-containing protein [Psidium guajava]|nr:Protein kinase domain-containing protein [Psidium guajava]